MATHFLGSCLENPRDGGAWWAAIYGVAQSRIRLKQLSSSHVLMSCRRLRHHPASAWKRPHSCSSGKFHFLKNSTAIPLTLYALGEPCHSPIKRCPPLEGGRPCDCPGAVLWKHCCVTSGCQVCCVFFEWGLLCQVLVVAYGN